MSKFRGVTDMRPLTDPVQCFVECRISEQLLFRIRYRHGKHALMADRNCCIKDENNLICTKRSLQSVTIMLLTFKQHILIEILK